MHGYIRLGEGKRLRADWLQAGRGAGSCRGTAVVYAIVGLNAGVDRGGGTRGTGFDSRTRGPRTTGAVPGVAGPAGLVDQPPGWLGGQHVGRVGLVMGGFIAIDLQAALSHGVQPSLLLATEKAQCRPLNAPQHAAAEARAVARVHEGIDARLEKNEHKAAQFKLVVREAALRRQNVLCQRNSHRQAAEQHGEHYDYAGDNRLRVFGCGQVDRRHQLTAGGSLGRARDQRLAGLVDTRVRGDFLQFVVSLVVVQRRVLNRTLHALEARCDEGRRGRRARGVHSDDRALSDLRVLPQRPRDHHIGHGHHGHAKGKVCQVDIQHYPGLSTSEAKVRQAGSIPARVRSHGKEGGHGEAGCPQQGGEGQRAGEGGGTVGLLPQNHAQSMQRNDSDRLQGHDDEARAGQVEGEAETLGHAVPSARIQEKHQCKHRSRHAANEQVAEGQVEDHEVKVGAELAEHRVEKGQEHHEIAIRAQAEDEDEEERAKGQGAGVDDGPTRRCLCAIEVRQSWHIHQV